jgi:hypothetical protein
MKNQKMFEHSLRALCHYHIYIFQQTEVVIMPNLQLEVHPSAETKQWLCLHNLNIMSFHVIMIILYLFVCLGTVVHCLPSDWKLDAVKPCAKVRDFNFLWGASCVNDLKVFPLRWTFSLSPVVVHIQYVD